MVLPHTSLAWELHRLKDFWGTKVWTKTSTTTTPLGFKLTSGYHPAYALMRNGQFEVEETEVILNFLNRVVVFVDIGANLGYYTCLALQNNKHVIAFEPQQQNLDCLYKNIQINNWQHNAEVIPVALSNKPGLLTLYGASGPSASLIKNWAGYSSSFNKIVAVNTLDNILNERYRNDKIFIKIDVEGAEYSVLEGALNTLKRDLKPIWLIEICLTEFHPQGKNPDFIKIFNLFFMNGYKAVTATRDMTSVYPKDVENWFQNGFTKLGTFNYIFIDSEESIFI